MEITIKDIKELVSTEQIPLDSKVTATMFGGQADLYIGTISIDGPNVNLKYSSKSAPNPITVNDLINIPDDKAIFIPSMDDYFNDIMEPATDMEYIPDSLTLNFYITNNTI